MSTGKPAKQGPNILGAIGDFLILVLLIGAAGGGGYYWGTIQRMAPVNLVGAGTPGAQLPQNPNAAAGKTPETSATSDKTGSTKGKDEKPAKSDPDKSKEKDPATPVSKADDSTDGSSADKKPKSLEYWVSSTGSDYIGYTVTVIVNGNAVDSFFGPGKTVDITRFVQSGNNTIVFDAKEMGEKYNKHKDDDKATLKLQLVSGPFMQAHFKQSDVICSFSRDASQSDDYKETKHFEKK